MRPAPLIVLLAGILLAAWAAPAAAQFDLPQGPGRNLVYGQCQTCHDLQSLVDSAGIGRGDWDAVLDNMRDFGLRVSAKQRAAILDYLATYLGPNPPPPAAAPAPEAAAVDGAKVFRDICSACHQPDGTGKKGEFPPLAGNRDLFLTPQFPVLVVLNGIEGPIKAAGRSYNNAMPAFDFLTDEEVAAVINHVRAQWGNEALAPAGMAKLSAADVGPLRARAMTAAGVHALRRSLLP